MKATETNMKCMRKAEANRYQTDIEELTKVITLRLPSFYKQARRRLSNTADAEDAIQDAFLSAYMHLNQFKGQARMSSWLTAIVINSARTTARRRPWPPQTSLDQKRRQEDRHTILDRLSDHRPDPEQIYRGRELAVLLAQLTKRLTPSLHKAFQLCDVDGFSIREAAEALGVPDGTVMSRVARARAILKRLAQRRLGRNCGAILCGKATY